MAGFAMTKRTIAVTAAVGLAAIATISLTTYVRGVEQRTLNGAEAVQTFVAKDTIPSGTTGATATSRGLIVREAIPRKAVAEGAIRSLTEIRTRVASINIMRGEQILASRFIKPTTARGLLPIPVDRQAMSVEVAVPPGVAGFVQAGDRISVVAQLDIAKSGDTAEPRVQYLLQDVQVLSVGQRVVVTEDKKEGSKVQQTQTKVLMTLALSPVEVEKLAYALFNGQVYFTLLPEGQQPAGTPGRTRENAFS